MKQAVSMQSATLAILGLVFFGAGCTTPTPAPVPPPKTEAQAVVQPPAPQTALAPTEPQQDPVAIDTEKTIPSPKPTTDVATKQRKDGAISLIPNVPREIIDPNAENKGGIIITPPLGSPDRPYATDTAFLELQRKLVPYAQPQDTVDVPQGETVDPPYIMKPVGLNIAPKILRFKTLIDDGRYTHETFIITINTRDYSFRVESDETDKLWVTGANGIVCYGKPTFTYAYCLREKYAGTDMALAFTGHDVTNLRRLSPSEKQLHDFMNLFDWIPGSTLVANQIQAILAIDALAKGELRDGTILRVTLDGKSRDVSTVSEMEDLPVTTKIATKGIHLAAFMHLVVNASAATGEPNFFGLAMFMPESSETVSDSSLIYDIIISGAKISQMWLDQTKQYETILP